MPPESGIGPLTIFDTSERSSPRVAHESPPKGLSFDSLLVNPPWQSVSEPPNAHFLERDSVPSAIAFHWG